MPLEDYASWELMPRRLNAEEMKDPLLAIHEFFACAHLPEIRQQLWELLKATITGSYCHVLNRQERSDLIHLYEKLEKLIEAAHLLYKNDIRTNSCIPERKLSAGQGL